MPRQETKNPADVCPTDKTDMLYSVFEDLCPTRLVLDRLADKWAVLILDRLQDGPLRFNSLKRDIKRITQKVLTQTLRKLERDGLIARQVFATVPVTVEYSLTPLGETLNEFITGLAHWAEHNIQAVLAAQAAFDAAAMPSTPANVTVHRL
ncbi:MAG: helix-turn-helix domain-containing protein [Rhodocyclaceae bacterium]